MVAQVSRTISNDSINRIIQIESSGDPDIKASTSSATGLGQFLNQTWLETLKKHGPPDLQRRIVKQGKRFVVPDGGEQAILNIRLGRTNDQRKFNVDMLTRFNEDNVRTLGEGWTDGDMYLAHFLGAGMARRVLRASPSTPFADLPDSADPIRANKTILGGGKTCGQVRAWAQNAMTSRWAKAGKKDWVAKYWYPGDVTGADLLDGRDEDPDEAQPVKVPVADDDPPIPHNQEGDDIRTVQQALKDLGYHEVGTVDGKWGGRTRGMIAAFTNDRHREDITVNNVTPELLGDLEEALRSGWTRPVALARAAAPDEVVAEKVPAVKDNWWTKLMGKLGFGVAGGGGTALAAADLISDHSETASDWWNKGQSFLESVGITDVPVWGWMIMAGLVFYIVWIKARAADQSLKDGYREGEIN